MKFFSALLLAFGVSSAVACSGPWGQCGGINFNGSSCCVSGYKCTYLNDWYSQCVPGSSSGGSSEKTTTKKTTTKKTTSIKTTNKKTSSIKTTSKKTTSSSQVPTYVPPRPSGDSKADGFASMNGGTTGGTGGEVISVSSASELISAVAGNEPKIINVSGIIKISTDLKIGGNTSIIGSGSNSGITGAGFVIKGVSNVIIQNLKFSFCLGSNKDCVLAQKSTNIWVDHCEFFSDRSHNKDYYDGLMDFTHASDYITISYNYVHDHYKASLIGHSDSNSGEDSGKLHITYHHNYFKNLNSRLPSLRFGTGHIYNNVYENIDTSCANIRMGAQALIEGNVFINAKRPISTNLDSKQEGLVVERDNEFGELESTNSITKIGSMTSAPYSCNVASSSSIYGSVVAGAGVGKI